MADIPIDKLFEKLKQLEGLEELLSKALLLFVLLIDADISVSTKALIVGALLYLIDPLDIVPDLTPFIGFLDDLAVIAALLTVLSNQIRPHHKYQAQSLAEEL